MIEYTKKTLLLVLLSLFSVACELVKETDYDIYYAGDKIVVHGLLDVDNGARVYVKKTISAADQNANDLIENPQVVLYENDVLFANLVKSTTDERLYILPVEAEIDGSKKYSIKVEANGFQPVFSDPVEVPAKLSIVDAFISTIDTIRSEMHLTIEIKRETSEYFFLLKLHRYIKGVDQLLYADLLNAYDVRSTNSYGERIIIDSKIDLVNYREYMKEPFDSVVAELISVSADYYKFGYSLNNYDISHNDAFEETITPVFSNINNGVGFFAIYRSSFLKLKSSNSN